MLICNCHLVSLDFSFSVPRSNFVLYGLAHSRNSARFLLERQPHLLFINTHKDCIMIENTQSLAGSGLGLLVTAATVLGLSWIIVLARSYARLQLHAFMSDDWLMTIGLVPFTITCVSAIMCAYNGVGSDFHDLDDDSYRAGCMVSLMLNSFVL